VYPINVPFIGHLRSKMLLSDALSLPKGKVEGGLPVYRTDEDGVVEATSDGAQVWVETEE